MPELNGPSADRQRLGARLREAREWERHGLTYEYQRYAAHEGEAARIAVYQPHVVPGLLQIERYAHAVTAAILDKPSDHVDVHTRALLRAERQRVIDERVAAGTPPTIVAAVEESVLRRPTGGADLMRDQLNHLLTQSRRPHVELVVMPSGLGGHIGLGGVFELLDFAEDSDRSMVFIESLASDFLTRDTTIVAVYRATIDRLRATGLTGSSALACIEEARDALA